MLDVVCVYTYQRSIIVHRRRISSNVFNVIQSFTTLTDQLSVESLLRLRSGWRCFVSKREFVRRMPSNRPRLSYRFYDVPRRKHGGSYPVYKEASRSNINTNQALPTVGSAQGRPGVRRLRNVNVVTVRMNWNASVNAYLKRRNETKDTDNFLVIVY
jgi:hypothetical protein